MLPLWSLVPSCAEAHSARAITYSCETGNKSNVPSWKENLCFACVRRCSTSIVCCSLLAVTIPPNWGLARELNSLLLILFAIDLMTSALHTCTQELQSRDPVAWPWCNLAANQRRLYYASVNSHSLMGLVSRQWDRRWLCLCTVWPSHSQIFRLTAILALGKSVSHSQIWAVGELIGLGDVMLCWEAYTRTTEWAGALSWWNWCARWVIVNETVAQYTSSSQRRLTPNWLAPWESVRGCWGGYPLTGYQVTSRPRFRFSRYSKRTDIFRAALAYKMFDLWVKSKPF
jgi:hypothetical protein